MSKRGRPTKPGATVVYVRVPDEVIASIDAHQRDLMTRTKLNLTRTDAIRNILLSWATKNPAVTR